MDPSWLALAALGLGVIVGGGAVGFFVAAGRTGARVKDVASPRVPEGVDQVLSALESAGVVVDPSGNVVRASPGAVALSLVWDDRLAHPQLDDIAREVRETGETITRDVDIVRGRFGDSRRVLSVRAARLGTRFILLLADDRTEAERLDEVRRDFVANISHELKTPIGAVGLLAEALEPAADDPAQVRRFASRLHEEQQRLARITGDIIRLSRLQAAEVLHQPLPVNVRTVVEQAVDRNRVAADRGSVDVVVGGQLDSVVVGDEEMLVVAIDNLVSNAVTYSPEGGRIGIGVSVADGAIEISVTDQGPGIPEEDRERVFERFFRVDPSRARGTGGTGLGLSIVKHTVQNHGGSVRLWSQQGHGSTFTIRLPQATEGGTSRVAVDEGVHRDDSHPAR